MTRVILEGACKVLVSLCQMTNKINSRISMQIKNNVEIIEKSDRIVTDIFWKEWSVLHYLNNYFTKK